VVPLTIDTLAAAPRWDLAKLTGLPGRCRGDALGRWGENLARRFGPDAHKRVQRRVGPPFDATAPVLTAKDWVPVGAQLALTEAIVDVFLGGDMRALYPLLLEDTRAGLGRLQVLAVKALGAGRVLARGAAGFGDIYEHGTADAQIDRGRARITFRGSPLFAHPTWRLLQLFATRTVMELAGSPGQVWGEHLGDDAFATLATW
jgi:hypothetical protein